MNNTKIILYLFPVFKNNTRWKTFNFETTSQSRVLIGVHFRNSDLQKTDLQDNLTVTATKTSRNLPCLHASRQQFQVLGPSSYKARTK